MTRSPAQKIILTGYRTSGKTTVGRRLAVQLGYEFLNMDLVITERAGSSIDQIIKTKGWQHFRQLERNLLEELIERDNIVIATGGGAILHEDIWPNLMRTSLVVWLSVDLLTIEERLIADNKTSEQRPPLTGESTLAEIEHVLQERSPLYKKGSHMVLDANTSSPEEIVEKIIKVLPNILPY